MTQSPSEVRRLLERHGVSPRKHLGQHFLADPNIVRKIVSLAGVAQGDQVVEVGTGTGALTAALADAGARVVSYEVDEGLRPLLEEALDGHDLAEVRFRDATEVDLASDLGAGRWKLVANLPYNVGTGILLDVLRHAPSVDPMVVMVQREVADRLVALPGSSEYGLPSVVVGMHARARLELTVPPQVFVPPPRVGSAVVRLDRIPAPSGSEAAIRLAATGFGQRRKMLRASLRNALFDPEHALAAAGVAPTARAEELSPAEWLRVAEAAGA